ncbi:PAP2 superfamily protein [Candidatus Rubidus massiliensis]|nr:PAP2 superfamily protein [Candidatus Rubidus massiliensis]
MIHEQELILLSFLQQFRSSFADIFFSILNHFDSVPYYLILLLILILVKPKTGLKVFCLFIASYYLGALLKDYFALPRPYHLNPELGLVKVGGYGFPSGAAQSAVIISNLIIRFFKNNWKWVVALSYFCLISVSRIYLGVHFFTDIIAGWFIGWILVTSLHSFFPLNHFDKEKSLLNSFKTYWIKDKKKAEFVRDEN